MNIDFSKPYYFHPASIERVESSAVDRYFVLNDSFCGLALIVRGNDPQLRFTFLLPVPETHIFIEDGNTGDVHDLHPGRGQMTFLLGPPNWYQWRGGTLKAVIVCQEGKTAITLMSVLPAGTCELYTGSPIGEFSLNL